jgi:dimethylargininase
VAKCDEAITSAMRKRIAITRAISPAISRCELTHLARQPIDLERAERQHHAYEERLREAGCSVVRLPADGSMPDSVFIEDAAVVFDELAVIARPGAESRRAEIPAVADTLRVYCPLGYIEDPGRLDGGDVLTVGRQVFVGESRRTNRAAIDQLTALVGGLGYAVTAVPIDAALHLKSAVTALSDTTLLINLAWVARDCFRAFDLVEVDPTEPFAANALRIGDQVIYAAAYARTLVRLTERGVRVLTVDADELAKAEGGLTCCSLIVST